MRILIVEDEIELCQAIAEGLQLDGYAVDCCYDGAQAYELIEVESYDLVVLDLNLPGMDGMEILRFVRNNNCDVKIIILSARANVTDKIEGLDSGANDYLTKPFTFEELEARIRNLLRRDFSQKRSTIRFENLELDTNKRTVYVDKEELQLTKKEFSILEYLLINYPRVISQEELMEHVWNMEADSFSNSVRVHINSMRKKIKAKLGYDPIITKIGEGYYLKRGADE